MRRGMQRVIALACSGRHELDMSIPMATISRDATLEPKSLRPSPFDLWDPLGFGEGASEAQVRNTRESELLHGRAVTTAVFFVSAVAVDAKVRGVSSRQSLATPRQRRQQLHAEPSDEPPTYDLLADIERFKKAKADADAAAGLPAAPPAPAAAAPPPVPAMAFDEVTPARTPTADDKLIADAARFRQRGPVEAPPENPVQGLINVLGNVLGVNFVVIVGLFLWFLSGVFSLYALDNDKIIIAVKAAFDPFILPLLSTHMGLTFFSYGLEKAFGTPDPDDDGGFRV